MFSQALGTLYAGVMNEHKVNEPLRGPSQLRTRDSNGEPLPVLMDAPAQPMLYKDPRKLPPTNVRSSGEIWADIVFVLSNENIPPHECLEILLPVLVRKFRLARKFEKDNEEAQDAAYNAVRVKGIKTYCIEK